MRARDILIPLMLIGCGTIGSPAGGDGDLPNANAGPFRLLRGEEIDRKTSGAPAPYLARSERERYRSPSPLDIDGDPETLAIWLYAAAGDDEASRIVRFSAEDGRSVDRTPETVLEASEPWERGRVFAPSALRARGKIWLFYAAQGGVGLAKSRDGRSFIKEAGPVLTDNLGCGGVVDIAPRDASLMVLPDGEFRLYFSQERHLCEAKSTDGANWQLVESPPEGKGVVLRVNEEPDAFDAASVSQPSASFALSPEGRLIVRIYYTGTDRHGRSAIGMAARYGLDGPFSRATSPVLRTELAVEGAAALAFEGFTLLYFTDRAGKSEALDYPAIAGAVAPASLSLGRAPAH